MPGYDTHYIFGMISYRQADSDNVRALIKTYRNEFALGLFGPDIFFYSIPETLSAGRNIGSIMHTEKTNLFFRNMYRFAAALPHAQPHVARKRIALSYFLGFLGHYCLDSTCHAFVYSRSGYSVNITNKQKYLSEHFSLETDIDITMLKRLFGEKPQEFGKKNRISLSRESISLIAEMLRFAVNQTYDEKTFSAASMKIAIRSIISGERLIRICPEKMKHYIENAEDRIIGHRYISPLIPGLCTVKSSDPLNLAHEQWSNPWDKNLTSTEDFPSLMNKAKAKYVHLMDLTDEAINSHNEEKLFKAIGNLSYHSGLPL